MTWARLFLLSLLVGCGDEAKEDGGDSGAFGAPAGMEPCGEGFGRADDGNCYPLASSSDGGPEDGDDDGADADGGGDTSADADGSGSDDGGSGSEDGGGSGSADGSGSGSDEGGGSGSADGSGSGSDDGGGSGESESRMIVEVAAGGFHTCVRYEDNTLDCWGRNDYSQSNPPTTTYKAISAGDFHTCAIATSGEVDCWGDNAHGKAVPQEGDFEQVSAGFNTTCAIGTDGVPQCWGRWPGSLETLTSMDLVDVDVGYTTCGANAADELVCWDYNHDTDACGATFYYDCYEYESAYKGGCIYGWGIPPWTEVSQVAVFGTGVCVIDTAGAMQCTGNCISGSYWGIDSIPGGTSTTSDIIDIDAGYNHICALDSTGPISCWGVNTAGKTAPPAGFFDYIQVSVGVDHSCGLEADGNLVCWGSDDDGQLGEYGY